MKLRYVNLMSSNPIVSNSEMSLNYRAFSDENEKANPHPGSTS